MAMQSALSEDADPVNSFAFRLQNPSQLAAAKSLPSRAMSEQTVPVRNGHGHHPPSLSKARCTVHHQQQPGALDILTGAASQSDDPFSSTSPLAFHSASLPSIAHTQSAGGGGNAVNGGKFRVSPQVQGKQQQYQRQTAHMLQNKMANSSFDSVHSNQNHSASQNK